MLLARRHAVTLALVAGLAVAAVACGGSSEPATTAATTAKGATTGGGAKVAAPVMVELATAEGKVVTARTGQTVVINTDRPTVWTGKVADLSVATFIAGRTDGSATFNPSLIDLRPGRTTVAVSDGTRTITFTLEVTAA